jgi:O-antigen/teichoic acid export membrane protein
MGIVRRQSFLNSISFYFGMAIGAINTIIIYPNAFKDNPEYFGLIQILIAYSIVIATFTTIGIPKIFIRYFPAIKHKGQLFFLSLITPLLGFVLALTTYLLFKSQIFEILNASSLLKENFFYIILLVFFIGFYDVLTAISRSFLSASTPVFINEVFLKLYSILMLSLYWFNFFDFPFFLKIYLFGYVLKFIILLFIQHRNKRISFTLSLNNLDLVDIFKYGFFVLLGGVSVLIVTRIDMMMLASLLDLEQVAYYTVAFFIGNAIMIPSRSISSISLPLISQACEKNEIDKIQSLYSKSSINQLITGGLFFVCVWLNIDDIFSLLPEKFSVGKYVVLYIGISQLFNMASGLNGEIIINSKFYRYDLYSSIFLVFLTIATNYYFIQKYGINGAAMATAISVFLFNLIRLVLLKIKMNMQPFSLKTIYTILLLVIIYLLLNFLPNSSYAFLDIIWKSLVVLIIFIPGVLYFNLSEDISLFVKDLKTNLL